MKTNFTFNHIGKALAICVSFVLFSNHVTAQITLSGISETNLISADTFIRAQNYQNFASMGMAKANGKWDVTSAEVGPLIYYYERFETSNKNFPSANYEKTISYLFAGSMEYSTTALMVADNSIVGALGEEILEEEVLPLASVTGNSGDQLIFPKQVIRYNETEREQVFPMTYNDNFKNTVQFTTKFNLTIAAFGLNNVPGERRTVRTTKDTVIGWGTIKVKHFRSKRVYEIPVLQVVEWATLQDSFYLGGNPAPAQLLAAFGISQGQQLSRRYTRFYRANEISPLVELHHVDASDDVHRVDVQQEGLDQGSVNVIDITNTVKPVFYPNPSGSNTITVVRPESGGNWSYAISDVFGRTLIQGDLKQAATEVDIQNLSSGNYIVRYYLEGNASSSGSVLLKP